MKDFVLNTREYEHVEIAVQFLIMKENYTEILKFKEIWTTFFLKNNISHGIVSDYNLQDYTNYKLNIVYRRTTTEQMDASNNLYLKGLKELSLLPHSRYDKMQETTAYKICTAPFRNLTVDWDGKVTFCCYDTYSELNLGNLNLDSLEDIWWGSKSDIIRMALYRNNNIPEICRNCNGFDAPALGPDELKKINKIYG